MRASLRVKSWFEKARFEPWGEAARSAAVIAAFVAIALGWAGIARFGSYPTPAVAAESSSRTRPTLWLVDGFNLLHAAVLRAGDSRDGWWKGENRARVLELARGFDDPAAEMVVVFDGAKPPEAESDDPWPRVVFAASADDWLLAAVREAPDPHRVAVVTADRRLADRLRDRGAQVVPPTAFAARCRKAAAL
jgi:hypothetical protein